jgi:lipopolysaccharide transport system ATP-binding protein
LYRPDEAKLIRFAVQWCNPTLPRLYLSALVKDEQGAIIAQCDSRLIGLEIDRVQEFQGRLTLRTPWLKPGEYAVDLVLCSTGSGILDWVERACAFQVAPVLPYSHASSAEATAMGSVLSDFDWTIT